MLMYLPLSMISHGKVLLNNLFFTFMNSSELDEVTPLEEHLPHSVRLTLLQTAVRSIPKLRIVKTMEQYMSLTQSSIHQYSLTYDEYFMMLQNACIRYDKTASKPSPTSRAVY